jgi:predicted MFS family arabinose efflux permease
MTTLTTLTTMPAPAAATPLAAATGRGALLRTVVIGGIAFLTLVDLFATQAILPMLAAHYRVTPAAMGTAVNASTLGMAASGLAVAALGRRLERRRGVLASLLLLAIPTALLSAAPDLMAFTALRVLQGLCMAAAFTLTLAYVAEQCSAAAAAGAFAAYVTGNVASNLLGRLMAAALVDHLGLAASFWVFALLNLSGALLVRLTLSRTPPMAAAAGRPGALAAWARHLGDPALRAAFALGFCILFAFIGIFTYVNFVLVRPPFSLGMMRLGAIYLVFLPAIVTTPLAGRAVARLGTRPTLWAGLAAAGLGLPLLLAASLPAVLLGLVLVGAGTFLAQAVATGFVGRAAVTDRAAASGLYLAAYFLGGLCGSAVLGRAFDAWGWPACVAGVGLALAAGAALALRLSLPPAPR